MQVLWGIGGMVVLLAIAFVLSTDRRTIKPRTVIGALVIQIVFAFVVLYWDLGRRGLQVITNGVQAVIDSSNAGIQFLFGPVLPNQGAGPVFAFQVLPIIVFFASLTSVLYYLGVLQFVVTLLGRGLQKALGTSGPESLSVTSDIFLGPTEAPLTVRPYIEKMTDSELFTVMVGGMASVAGSTLVGYSLLGAPLDYLLAAALMSAPAALLMAKIMMPETEEPGSRTPDAEDEALLQDVLDDRNVIDAAARGAAEGPQAGLERRGDADRLYLAHRPPEPTAGRAGRTVRVR